MIVHFLPTNIIPVDWFEYILAVLTGLTVADSCRSKQILTLTQGSGATLALPFIVMPKSLNRYFSYLKKFAKLRTTFGFTPTMLKMKTFRVKIFC